MNTLDPAGLAAATAAVAAEIARYCNDDTVDAGHEPVAAAAIHAYLTATSSNPGLLGARVLAAGQLKSVASVRIGRARSATRTDTVKATVKALAWRKGYCDEEVTIQQASFGGLYQVRVLDGIIWMDWPDRPATDFATIEAAKAAAQADFEARILSALDVPAHPEGVKAANPSSQTSGSGA